VLWLLLVLLVLVFSHDVSSSELSSGGGVIVDERATETCSAADNLIPPVIDLSEPNRKELIVQALSCWGFFHVLSHGIRDEQKESLQQEMAQFFQSPMDLKRQVRRMANNSRGYADDELTKQKRDKKEIFDFGHKPNPFARDDDPSNIVLDGYNQFPDSSLFPNFRNVVWEYYHACEFVAVMLTQIIGEALDETIGEDKDALLPSCCNASQVLAEAFASHTSFLRLNYYAPSDEEVDDEVFGVSRHTDAGFLTVLLQDVPGLEVYTGTKQDANDGFWVPVNPVVNAVTINAGDMLQVYSGGRFKAPEHRVRKSTLASGERYSAPFFYNPSYDALVQPLTSSPIKDYTPIRWREFRWRRFAGDFADVGKEVQIEDFEKEAFGRS